MFVLDADILTLRFAGHSWVVSRRDHVRSADIATTVVSRIQSLQGRFQFLLKAATGADLLRAQSLLDGTLRALAKVETLLAIDVLAAAEFDRLRQHNNGSLRCRVFVREKTQDGHVAWHRKWRCRESPRLRCPELGNQSGRFQLPIGSLRTRCRPSSTTTMAPWVRSALDLPSTSSRRWITKSARVFRNRNRTTLTICPPLP